MSRVREIIFYGKSGDNLQNVTDKLVQSLIKRGLYVTAYSDYDPERRESVAKVHVRIADGPIDVRGPVIAPEIAVLWI
jgi:pyruvate ferredoxin oxidoreductase gamma subunit